MVQSPEVATDKVWALTLLSEVHIWDMVTPKWGAPMMEMVMTKVIRGMLKLAGWGMRRHNCLHSACRDLSVRLLAVYCQKCVHQPAVRKRHPQVR